MLRNSIYYITALFALSGAITGTVLILQKNNHRQDLLPEVHADPAITTEASNTDITSGSKDAPTFATTSTNAENGYILLLQNDTLYVYPDGQAEAIETYYIASAWLPEYDRILLENGLYAETAAEVRQLLEDYTS